MRNFFRAYDRVIEALAWLCGASIAAVFVAVTVSVSMRMVGIQEPDWVLHTTEYAMLYVGTLAAPWLLRERGHVCIEIVRQAVPERVRHALERVVYLLGFLVSSLLVYFTVPAIRSTWGEFELRAYVVYKVWLIAPVGIAFLLLAIGFLRLLLGYGSLYEQAGRARTGEL